jgi:hypothetical protein
MRVKVAIQLLGLMFIGLMSAPIAGAAGPPMFNSFFADKPVTPTSFSPARICDITANEAGCQLFNNWVRRIQWSSWGGPVAEGRGEVTLLDGQGSTSPVTVTLGGLKNCAGFQVYTTYSLALVPGSQEPPNFAMGDRGTFPCTLSLAGGYRGNRLGRNANCINGLWDPSKDFGYAPWVPKAPDPNWLLCQLQFKAWGSPTTIGTGTIRRQRQVKGRHEWPIKIVVSRPIWCPKAGQGFGGAITYSRVKVTLKGKDLANARGKRSYRQAINPTAENCILNGPEKDIYGNILGLSLTR